ncbi:MAG: hypothetical protein ACRDJE_08590 [Dehalococcoidia bacterium]
MATFENGESVEDADVAGFAVKLDAWARDLTPAEQTLLNRMIERAASAAPEPEDTQGYIIIVNSLTARPFALDAGQPSLLLRRAVGVSDFTIVKVGDKSSP